MLYFTLYGFRMHAGPVIPDYHLFRPADDIVKRTTQTIEAIAWNNNSLGFRIGLWTSLHVKQGLYAMPGLRLCHIVVFSFLPLSRQAKMAWKCCSLGSCLLR